MHIQIRVGSPDCVHLSRVTWHLPFPYTHTRIRIKRDLLQCQKRPTTVSKETYYCVKRDLLQCQKRPTTVSKETYYSVKRDLQQGQKRPTTVTWHLPFPYTHTRIRIHIREGSLDCVDCVHPAYTIPHTERHTQETHTHTHTHLLSHSLTHTHRRTQNDTG
jgi:hypothetical protein